MEAIQRVIAFYAYREFKPNNNKLIFRGYAQKNGLLNLASYNDLRDRLCSMARNDFDETSCSYISVFVDNHSGFLVETNSGLKVIYYFHDWTLSIYAE